MPVQATMTKGSPGGARPIMSVAGQFMTLDPTGKISDQFDLE